MPLVDHLEELRQRVLGSLLAVVLSALVCLLGVKPLVRLLEAPAQGIHFLQLAPGEFLFVSLKVAGYAGLTLALPYVLFQLLAFVLPGLTIRERRLIAPAVAGSAVLFLAGIAFATVGWKQACQRQLIKLDGPRRLRHFALISSGVLVTLFFSLNQLGSGTRWYRRTLDEGSLVEWITCLAFLLSAWLLWRAAGRFDGRLQRLVLRAMGVACFVIAMEEISWGQMVFNWQSPDWFMGSNSQQETSLHNIKGINSSVDVAFLIGLLGLTIGSVLTHLSHRRHPARSGAWGDILFPPTYLLGFFVPSLAVVACVVADASFGVRILLPGEIEIAELILCPPSIISLFSPIKLFNLPDLISSKRPFNLIFFMLFLMLSSEILNIFLTAAIEVLML